MRIALLSPPFISVPPKNYGGTELVIYELAEGLAQRGHDVTLFGTGDSHTSAKLRSIYPKAQWPPDALTDANQVSWALSEVIADGGFDVIHAHSALALSLHRFVSDVPLIYTIHHERERNLSQAYAAFPGATYIFISHNQKKLEIPLPHSEVIYHGLDPSRYEWTGHARDYVCFLGRFAEIKGPHIAMDVAEQAGVKIKLAGEIHPTDKAFGDREVLPRLSRPHVEYLGCLGTREKVPLLRDARALLAPIQWEEPFGLFLIEAMLSGCPVVAFPLGSVRELVEPGVTGFIVESKEEMAQLIRPGGPLDSFDRQRCRHRAVERFSRARMITDHEQAYTHLIQRFAKRPQITPVLQAI
jgi:glycosyltransferase involved in cell wall biosynthesis